MRRQPGSETMPRLAERAPDRARAGIVGGEHALRVGVVCDLAEEGWPSMDLVGDMVCHYLERDHGDRVIAGRIRPAMRRRFSRGGEASPEGGRWGLSADRLLNRFADYPLHLWRRRKAYDVFHLMDHSYAQLVHVLPAGRTVVTCHDLDTFRSVLDPSRERRGRAFRGMTAGILAGLRQAARVVCVSTATRDEILAHGLLAPERLSVIPNGVHPSCSPAADPLSDAEADRLLGPASGGIDLLHVGSTNDRKRIDLLLQVYAAARREQPLLRLVRVGGAFTPEQARMVADLGVKDGILVLPSLSRGVLAAVYRRAALVLQTSEREGFGLPVVEALACGTPVIATDIEVLREVGRGVVTYRPLGAVAQWRDAIGELLEERAHRPQEWVARRQAGIAHAANFSWSESVRKMVSLYRKVLAG